jgi:hypothetical protein
MAYRIVELKKMGRGYAKVTLESDLSLELAESKIDTYVVNNPGIFLSIEEQ